MAIINPSQLPEISSLNDDDYVLVSQGDLLKRISYANLKKQINPDIEKDKYPILVGEANGVMRYKQGIIDAVTKDGQYAGIYHFNLTEAINADEYMFFGVGYYIYCPVEYIQYDASNPTQ